METKLVSQPTRCKLCKHIFTEDLLKTATILGATPQAKLTQVAAVVQPLMRHLQKHHPEALQQAQLAGGQLAGYLALLCFECDEETKIKMGQDFTRWKVHCLTARPDAHPSDDRIRERVSEIVTKFRALEGPPPVTLENQIVALLCEMRDAIEEKGRYAQGESVPSVSMDGQVS